MFFRAAILSLIALAAGAQTPRPSFETASVKPNSDPDVRNGRFDFLPGGKLIVRNTPLLFILATAYNIPFQSPRLTGGPDWQKAILERFDIDAIAGESALPSTLSSMERAVKMKLMLQSLLEDRFKLKMRIEPKEQPVYAILIAPGGPKLEKFKLQESACTETSKCHDLTGGQGRGLHAEAASIADIALFVQNWSDRPVIDKTGLTALYKIDTDGWMPMRQSPPRPDGLPAGDAGLNDPDRKTLSSIFNELGLKMDPQRAVVDMFIIERLEPPTAN